MPDNLGACVIRKLIDCQEVNGHTRRLTPPWQEIAEALQSTPPSRNQRGQAFEAALASQGDADVIRDAVLQADRNADLDQLAATNQPETFDRFLLHWASEALEPQPPVDWIVTGLFSAGSVSLIYGEGGSKKTWAMLDLAVCVGNGEKWLDFTTQRCTVLLIDEESGPRRLSRRLGDVIRGHMAEKNPPSVAFTSLAAFDLRNPEDANALHVLIEQTSARLVIIDALADVMPGGDENAVKDIQPLMLTLRKIAHVTNCAVVLIHHANKGGQYRGSTALKGAVDLLITVESNPQSTLIEFKTEKARDVEPAIFSGEANFMTDAGQFWLSEGHAQNKNHFPRSQKYVLRFLKEMGQARLEDVKNNADTCSPSGARQAVYALLEKEMVRRTNPGETGRGVEAIYELTDQGKEAAEWV